MISDDFKQQLLQRVDIVDVIERHVQLRKAGQNFVARCPFHNEKTPSFTVSATKQFYHCFGCGAHGNAITFLMEHGGAGYVDAVKELAAMVGMAVPQASGQAASGDSGRSSELSAALSQAGRYYKEQLKRSEKAIAYLKRRGVTGEVAARFGLGYAPAGWQGLAQIFPDYASSSVLRDAGLVIDGEGGRRYDRFRDRIMFPILDARGGLIGFGGRVLGEGEPKYLNSPETPLFEKGRELFGLFQARSSIRRQGHIVVVEGYMDVVALHQHGVDCAVATLGTATTPAHVAKLLKLADALFFCFDGDAAGRKAAWRALENSLELLVDGKQISFMFLPEGEDPDSYVRKCAASAVWTALPLSEFLTNELSARVDMRTVEGRARFLQLAKPLVTRITAPAIALQLRRRLARLADVAPEEVERLFGLRRAAVPASTAPRGTSQTRTSPATLMRWVLVGVLHHPDLAVQIDRAVLERDDPCFPALIQVLDLIAARPHIGAKDIVPMVLDSLKVSEAGSVLREVVADIVRTGELDYRSEAQHALRALQDRSQRKRLTALFAMGSRSPAEQAELADLLRTLQQRAVQEQQRIHSGV